MKNLEAEGYGAFSSRSELEEAIAQRIIDGKSPYGEATIYLGGEIVKGVDGSISLDIVDGKVVIQNARVYPTGEYKLFMDDPSNGQLLPPPGWREIENP